MRYEVITARFKDDDLKRVVIKWIPSFWDKLFRFYNKNQRGVCMYYKDIDGIWGQIENQREVYVPPTKFFNLLNEKIKRNER